MATVVTIMLMLLLYIIYTIEKSVSHPMIILLGEWLLIFMLCAVNIYKYTISSKTYLIILLGLFGCMCGYFFNKKEFKYNKYTIVEKELSQNKMYIIVVVEVVMFIILLSYYRNMKGILDSGISYGEIRYSHLKDVIGQNPVYSVIFSYLVRPFGILLMPLSVYFLSKDNRIITRFIFLIELINVLLITIVMGERMYLFYYVFFVVTTYLCARKKEGKATSKKFKKMVIIIAILFVGVFSSISKSRIESNSYSNNERESLIEKAQDTAYLYFSGCVAHMTEKVLLFDQIGSDDKYTYGFTSFQGVIRPLHQVVEFITNDTFNSDSLFSRADEQKNEIESAIMLDGHRFNGYISMFYYFYVDLGLIGVLLLSFLTSLWINYRYSYYVATGLQYNLIRYLLAVSIFAFSFFQFMLSNLDLPMAFVYCVLLFLPRIKIKASVN